MAVKPVVKVSYGRDALTLEEGKDYKLVGVGAYTEPTTTKKYTVSVEGINERMVLFLLGTYFTAPFLCQNLSCDCRKIFLVNKYLL